MTLSIDKRKKFTKEHISLASQNPGIYFIWGGKGNRCYYVGKATSIRDRLRSHLNEPSDRLKDYIKLGNATFSFIEMPNSSPKERTTEEDKYIDCLNPHGNIVGSKRI